MPIDDLTALGQKMREARKKKDLTQQELADLSHVSVKQIANTRTNLYQSYLFEDDYDNPIIFTRGYIDSNEAIFTEDRKSTRLNSSHRT